MQDALKGNGKRPSAPLLTMREAEDEETVNELAEALQEYGKYFDQALSALAADGATADIWADAGEWEWRIRAQALLHAGTRNRRVAAVVRVALNLKEQIALWAWLGSDSWRTVKFVNEHGVKVRHARASKPYIILGGKQQAQAQAQKQPPPRVVDAAPVASQSKG